MHDTYVCIYIYTFSALYKKLIVTSKVLSSLDIHVTIAKKDKTSMDTSSVFSRGIEIRMSLLPRSDPPSFALFSLAHKSLSLGLSETYFPVETAFLNSIRSYWRANRRGTRARRESKKSPHVPRKADRCPVTALSLLDSWIFTRSACARGHVYIFIPRRFSPPGISPRREVFACAREREHDVYAFRVHGRLSPVDVERRRTELGISWITFCE